MQQYSANIKSITRQLAIGVEDYYVAETEDTDGIEVSEETPSAKEDDPYFGSNPPF